jgi:hypothetical protein
MNLHEIIHAYLEMPSDAGKRWLDELVRDAGLDKALIPHIIACRTKEGKD